MADFGSIQVICVYCVIYLRIGKSNFQFKISPLDGDNINSAKLLFFLDHVAPPIKGVSRVGGITKQIFGCSVTPGGQFMNQTKVVFFFTIQPELLILNLGFKLFLSHKILTPNLEFQLFHKEDKIFYLNKDGNLIHLITQE